MRKSRYNFIIMIKTKTFILVTLALLAASCTWRLTSDTPISPSDRTATEQDLAPSSYDVLFTLGDKTKADIRIVDGAEISRTGFYASSRTSLTGSSSAQWQNVHFMDGGSGLFSGGRVWANSDLGYSFYASNVRMSQEQQPKVVVNTIDTDIVCAYLPEERVSFQQNNELRFSHILSRIDRVSLESVLGDMTGMTVKAVCNTSGTYDIASDSWTGIGGQQTIVFTPGSNDRKWVIPGIYLVEMDFTDRKGNARHFEKELSFNSGVASIIECQIPHSGLYVPEETADEAADMYIAQKKRLCIDGTGDNYQPEQLHWSVVSGSGNLRLNSNVGSSVEFVGLDDGNAVVKVTDGIEEVTINVTVKKPHLIYKYAGNLPLRVGLDGLPVALEWDFKDDYGNNIPDMDWEICAQMLSPDPVFFAYDDKMKDVISVVLDSEVEEILVSTHNIDLFEGTGYSSMSGLYRTFICNYDLYDSSYLTGRLDTANGNLAFNTADSPEIKVKLPVVKACKPENLSVINEYWSTGKRITGTAPFIDIANAGDSRLEAYCYYSQSVHPEYRMNYESNGISVSWPNFSSYDYSRFMGAYNISIMCRNTADGSCLTLIPHDMMNVNVKMELGIVLRLGYDTSRWWIATTPADNNVYSSLPSDVYRNDVIRNYIQWNPDITFEESDMSQSTKVRNQLGQAIALDKIQEYYNFPRPLENGIVVNMSDFILKPGVDETDFQYPYIAEIEYKSNHADNMYLWGAIDADGKLPKDIYGGDTNQYIIYKILYDLR